MVPEKAHKATTLEFSKSQKNLVFLPKVLTLSENPTSGLVTRVVARLRRRGVLHRPAA